jgi:hypothetical protein
VRMMLVLLLLFFMKLIKGRMWLILTIIMRCVIYTSSIGPIASWTLKIFCLTGEVHSQGQVLTCTIRR